MGPGSVIGVTNVLNYEAWVYRARPLRNTEVIEINRDLIKSMMVQDENLNKFVEEFILFEEMNGMP